MRRPVVAVLTLAAVTGLLTAVAAALTLRHDPDGAADPRAAVAEYVAALRTQDRARLDRIADPGHIAAGEIHDRLQRLGGPRLVVTDTRITPTESAATRAAALTATLNGAPYTETLWLYGHGEPWPGTATRWFVALGPNRDAHFK